MTELAAQHRELSGSRSSDVALTATLFRLNLVAVLGRAVFPNTIAFIQHGRPAPTSPPNAITGSAHLMSSAFSLMTVFVTFASLIVLRPTVARLRPLVLGWILYVSYEALVAIHRGGWTLSTTFVSICALVTMLWLDVDIAAAVRASLRLITGVGGLSLLMAVLYPSVAKYGDVSAAWFTRNARLAGPFSTPNEESDLFALGVTLWFASWRQSARAIPTMRAALQLALLALPLVLSESYTAWSATAAGVTVVMLGRVEQPYRRPSRLWTAVLIACLYPASRGLLYLDSRGSATGLSGRRLVWVFVEHNWRSAYLIGHGAGTWRSLIQVGALPAWAVNGHDQVLDTLYTGGVVGLAALSIVLLAMAAAGTRAWFRGSSVALACIVVEIVRSYTEVPLEVIFGGLNLFVLLTILGLLPRAGLLAARPIPESAVPLTAPGGA